MAKIMHVIPSLSRGGAERFVVDLCNELAKTNEVYLVSLFDNNKDSFKDEVSENVQVISIGKKSGFDMKTLLRTLRLINNVKPDIVNSHINALEYILFYRLFKVKSKTIKFFHTIHNEANKDVANFLAFFLRKKLFSSKLVIPITISKTMSKSFEEFYDLFGYDIQIDNGRPYRQFDKTKRDAIKAKYKGNGQQLFVNVARIDAQKNQLNLVKAFKSKCLRMKGAVLLVLGDVRDKDLYNEILTETQGECNIHLVGGVSNVEDYLAACDAFILPSIFEGMPISLIEALSHGCVPICTPVGGVADMIEDKINGFLISGTSAEDISNAILSYIDSENINLIRYNARESFHSRYDIETTSLNYLDAYAT
ncbi:glycosyltransferase family 4 protein [Sphingobacterium paucimobilis]|uniref:Glycosyltransferase subfamily 4-like N-terminal domain-containing protein n=1 Tax=Sphingobacterium paucimobilis HER1398 TaxID=1346330 RepID=U2HQH8_9SPHI|nr:glycosyltransferase family 4 protein [Sphingobacterium paucimobilis]ERJ57727.1 hypothetical protein M472_03005 [Sphingobacterium paucimobilis HER1398]